MSSGNISLMARVSLPAMPETLMLNGLKHATLDQALAAGADAVKVDVGDLDDKAIADVCNAWTLEFTRYAKARRALRHPVVQGDGLARA